MKKNDSLLSFAQPSSQSRIFPRHIAIIMDGNGRWAKMRNLPRMAGHKVGVDSVKAITKACGAKGIEVLTLFAFSTENWQRPQEEVNFLMDLILVVFRNEIKELHANNVQVHVIGDRLKLNAKVRAAIERAEKLTCSNSGLKLVVALNYSGRWDIANATQKIAGRIARGELKVEDIDEELLSCNMALGNLPMPDLFIRTSGEKRISNFMLWQIAYSELYFTDTLWPDFREKDLEAALVDYSNRERRFGKTGDQLS
jgi:undecaprenyl diphosphate synthase